MSNPIIKELWKDDSGVVTIAYANKEIVCFISTYGGDKSFLSLVEFKSNYKLVF